MDEEEILEEEIEGDEWARYRIEIPDDDFDEDDAEEQRIEAIQKALSKRNVNRGGFRGV